jgi:predicted metal-dependent hydrolase
MPANLPAGVDEGMVERCASAIERAELQWKADNGGDNISTLECPDEIKALSALTAALGDTHCVVSDEALRQARMMSNLCFNLKQKLTLSQRAREEMEECQVAFDKAMRPAASNPGASS